MNLTKDLEEDKLASKFYTRGNSIKSMVINQGWEVWIQRFTVYRLPPPFEILKAGSYNALKYIDVGVSHTKVYLSTFR
jgi:hypothetical protein